MTARIELVGADDQIIISGGTGRDIDGDGTILGLSPSGIFGTAFTSKLIHASGQIGAREGGVDVPARQIVLPLDLWDTGAGVAATVSRLRKMFGTMFTRRPVRFAYSSEFSGTRFLTVKIDKEIDFSPEQDWELDGYARAVVSAVALEPRYESHPYTAEATTTAANQTIWFPVWNPTDQVGWPNWSLIPNGTGKRFTIPDFSFGQEQEVDRSWSVGSHAARTVQTVPISVPWNVIPVRSGMDPYVAADLSNASGQMGGLFPLYGMPARTGTEHDPILMPVTVTGAAGATIRLEMRRFWSAESGLE